MGNEDILSTYKETVNIKNGSLGSRAEVCTAPEVEFSHCCEQRIKNR